MIKCTYQVPQLPDPCPKNAQKRSFFSPQLRTGKSTCSKARLGLETSCLRFPYPATLTNDFTFGKARFTLTCIKFGHLESSPSGSLNRMIAKGSDMSRWRRIAFTPVAGKPWPPPRKTSTFSKEPTKHFGSVMSLLGEMMAPVHKRTPPFVKLRRTKARYLANAGGTTSPPMMWDSLESDVSVERGDEENGVEREEKCGCALEA